MKKVIRADSKALQKKLLDFRKKLYSGQKIYVDNNYYMLKEIFSDKLNFTKNMSVCPLIVTENENVLCCGIAAYTRDLPDYVQLCFFEALPDEADAVALLVKETEKLGKEYGCRKIVIGLYGHVNYGLGLLDSHFESRNSFSSSGNPAYYNDYFRSLGCEEIGLSSYYTAKLDDRLDRFSRLIAKLERSYEFRCFDKSKFSEYAKIYTDLNNSCFSEHRYYYKRGYEDDLEMLKTLFLFMKEDSLIFAFHDGKPVGFIMWYPDWNELAAPGEIFGTKHFFLNILKGKNISTGKVMEYGVLEEYRSAGLPMALIKHVYDSMKKQGCIHMETSWILDENTDSNSFCKALCDETYKKYVVYEKDIV